MKCTIFFKDSEDMDNFYNEFVGSIADESVSVSASVQDATVTVAVRDSDFEREKTLINEIKQYMRDNTIDYRIEV